MISVRRIGGAFWCNRLLAGSNAYALDFYVIFVLNEQKIVHIIMLKKILNHGRFFLLFRVAGCIISKLFKEEIFYKQLC